MSSHWLGAHPPNDGQTPVVTSILKDFSAEALGELRTWLEQNPPAITIQSIVGFTGFTGRSADLSTTETTTSTTYTNLATVGPQLSGLPDGSYLVWFGAKMAIGTDLEQGRMSIALNGVALGDTHCVATQSSKLGSLSHAVGVNTGAAGGNNTLTAKYKSSNAAVTATFENRFLIALKFANP